MTPVEIISEALIRLRADYDEAHAHALLDGNDEDLITLYLPGEWAILARRMCELIVVEVMNNARTTAARAPDAVKCAGCGLALWRVSVSPLTGRRRTECASCGMACHV